MIKRLASVGLLAVTAGTLWSLSRQLQARGRQEPVKGKPAPVQTWEGEGGALPATGAQMGPDPVVPASESAAVAREDGQGTVH